MKRIHFLVCLLNGVKQSASKPRGLINHLVIFLVEDKKGQRIAVTISRSKTVHRDVCLVLGIYIFKLVTAVS